MLIWSGDVELDNCFLGLHPVHASSTKDRDNGCDRSRRDTRCYLSNIAVWNCLKDKELTWICNYANSTGVLDRRPGIHTSTGMNDTAVECHVNPRDDEAVHCTVHSGGSHAECKSCSGVSTDSHIHLDFTGCVSLCVSSSSIRPECLYKAKNGKLLPRENHQSRSSISRMINNARFIRPDCQSATTINLNPIVSAFVLVHTLSAATEHTKL